MDSDEEETTSQFLERRQQLTEKLYNSPYDLVLYLERAAVHSDLGYPDLACGDSYRALLLCDEVRDESFEYHEQALETLRSRFADQDGLPAVLRKYGTENGDLLKTVENIRLEDEDEDEEHKLLQYATEASIRCYQTLALSLLLCGCLKSAYDFCKRGLDVAPEDEELGQVKEYILNMGKRRLKVEEVDVADLPNQGLVRREVYPWNDHEPDRFSEETLNFLNSE